MNYQLYKTLRRHQKLSEKRHVAWEQNKTAKYMIYFMSAFMIVYLMFLAVMFSLIINNSKRITAYEFMYGIMPFILALGFFIRFTTQQTPSQLVKPYALLPVPRYACIDCFLINQLQSSFNLLGFAMFVPYAIMSVVFSEGLLVAFGFLFGLYLLVLINSQWYLLVRSLINIHVLWWLLPIAVYAIAFSPLYSPISIASILDTSSPLLEPQQPGINVFCNFYAQLGEGLSFWKPLYYIGVLMVLGGLFAINRKLQHRLIWQELGKTEKAEKASKMEFTALSRFGEIGEYLKLEIKSIMRNKNLRKSFIFANIAVVMFSLLLSFTDIYDSEFMNDFWCIYCFSIYGAMLLSKVMCYEGNYIECLMVHRENIYTLLRSKYYFYCAMLLLPLILMLPTVFMEKCTLLQLLAYTFFTGGAAYALYFQMAIINKQTMPLNTKFIGKGSMENNWVQVAVQLFIFFFPLLFIRILQLFFEKETAYLIILFTGVLFIVTHTLWLRNIYRRMMKRRYENLEGFRSSRD